MSLAVYQKPEDLPEDLKRRLTPSAARVYVDAFNNAWTEFERRARENPKECCGTCSPERRAQELEAERYRYAYRVAMTAAGWPGGAGF